MEEIWKDVIGYEGLYQVSNLGNVKSLERFKQNHSILMKVKEKLLKPIINIKGYYIVNLSNNGIQKRIEIHKLVAIMFLNHLPNKYDYVIDHIDNNKLNNNVINLQIISQRENSSKDRKNTNSIYTGVCYVKKINRWSASIYIKPKRKHLGYFKTELEAHQAYQNALNNL